jgi:hypothetical protein
VEIQQEMQEGVVTTNEEEQPMETAWVMTYGCWLLIYHDDWTTRANNAY